MRFRTKILIFIFVFLISFVLIDLIIGRLTPKLCANIQSDQVFYQSLIPLSSCKVTTKEFGVIYNINQYGLRDNNFTKEKPQGLYRILFLGDSFTYGTGVNLEETMVKKTEKTLNQTFADRKIQTINAAVSSYGILQDYLYLINKGLEFQPDMVIVNLTMTDFFDERRLKLTVKSNDQEAIALIPPVQKLYLPKFLHSFAKDHSFIYKTFLRKEEDLWKLKGRLFSFLKREKPPDYTRSNFDFTPGDLDQDTFAITRDLPKDQFDELFKPVIDRLLKIKNFLDSKNIRFVLVVIPAAHQVNSNQWQEGRKAMKLKDAAYPTKIFDSLEEFSEVNDIMVLNTVTDLHLFTSQNPSAKLYFDFDGHLSPQGHTIMAKSISDFLIQKDSQFKIF